MKKQRLSVLRAQLQRSGNSKKARILSGFFKTGPGEYGEGDRFLGIMVPKLRSIAGSCGDLSPSELLALLASGVHEERSLALMVLCKQFKSADEEGRNKVVKFYLKNLKYINNWDLVDGSAPYILGPSLFRTDTSLLYKLAGSKVLWERRISIITTLHFIRENYFTDTLRLSDKLLRDEEDLIHKAVGWCL